MSDKPYVMNEAEQSYQDVILGCRALVVRAGLCDWAEAQDLDHGTLQALGHQILDERGECTCAEGR